MSMARCTGCKKVMTHVEFDMHDCPGSPGPPLDGESWLDYKARCEKWRQDQGLPPEGWGKRGETCESS